MTRRDFPLHPILLVDDELPFLTAMRFALANNGFTNVLICNEPKNVETLLAQQEVWLVVLDMLMPEVSGEDTLQLIAERFPDVPVVVVTAVDDVDTAVRCMKMGALDYLTKPVDTTRLITMAKRSVDLHASREESRALRRSLFSQELQDPDMFAEVITQDASMRSIFSYIEAIAPSPQPVLITGETGVGKELFARLVHRSSGRRGDMVTVNVPSIDGNMFADALFGHTKGAFTSAIQQRPGLIEKASDGTLFLDEIGDLGGESQVKLLRLLQDGDFFAVGSDLRRISNARVVAATNRNIASMQEEGRFRRDLFYRLAAHRIHIPPLRKRKGDIGLLLDYFLGKAAAALNKPKPTPPKQLISLLECYDFPGNVRELEGMVFDAVSCHRAGVLSTRFFAEKIANKGDDGGLVDGDLRQHSSPHLIGIPDAFPTLKEVEQQLIREALDRADGNQTIAARLLGLSRQALNNRLRRRKKGA